MYITYPAILISKEKAMRSRQMLMQIFDMDNERYKYPPTDGKFACLPGSPYPVNVIITDRLTQKVYDAAWGWDDKKLFKHNIKILAQVLSDEAPELASALLEFDSLGGYGNVTFTNGVFVCVLELIRRYVTGEDLTVLSMN
jgi:hypothetical protein